MKNIMEISQQFAELVESLRATLKSYGYKRQGNYFYKQDNENVCVIQLQKSMSSSANEIKFTVNLGVCSQAIRQFGSVTPPKNKPIIDDCHWNRRLGELLPIKYDKWWYINENTHINELKQELQSHIVSLVIPEIEAYSQDEQLLALWMTGQCPGITDIKRLINVCILLKKFARQDELAKTLLYLDKVSEGKPYAPMVERVKKQLLG